MADIAVNGPPQIKPVAAMPRQVAASKPRPHDPGEMCRRGVSSLDLLGVGHFAKIDFSEIGGHGGAFLAAFAAAVAVRAVAGCNLVHCGTAARARRGAVV